MSIQSYIENVKSKPEHVRRKTAFWWAFGFTAIIFTFWLGSFTGVNIKAGNSIAATVNKAGSPGQGLVAGVGALGNDVWQLIFGTKKVVYPSIEVVPGSK